MNNLSFLTDEKINFITQSPTAFRDKNLATFDEQSKESVLKKYVSENCLIKPLSMEDVYNKIWQSEKIGNVSLISEKFFSSEIKGYYLELFLCVKL